LQYLQQGCKAIKLNPIATEILFCVMGFSPIETQKRLERIAGTHFQKAPLFVFKKFLKQMFGTITYGKT